MLKIIYTPNRGDIIWLNFSPQKGKEQAGKRPALVISPKVYNRKVGLALCCPITSRVKGYPFEVSISGSRTSAVLSDQIKSLDWKARNARKKGQVTSTELAEVRAKIKALVL